MWSNYSRDSPSGNKHWSLVFWAHSVLPHSVLSPCWSSLYALAQLGSKSPCPSQTEFIPVRAANHLEMGITFNFIRIVISWISVNSGPLLPLPPPHDKVLCSSGWPQTLCNWGWSWTSDLFPLPPGCIPTAGPCTSSASTSWLSCTVSYGLSMSVSIHIHQCLHIYGLFRF